MNTKKILFGILTMGILTGAACTTDNADVYEQSVDKTKITKGPKKQAVDKTKITKGPSKQAVDKTKITKGPKKTNS
jgi:hypothetical protein